MSDQKARLIVFDESLGERGRISLDFSYLAGLLRRNGYRTETFQDRIEELSLEQLVKISAFVMVAPSNQTLKKPILARILRYVELGGGLILLADGGGDRALKANISQLSQYFGVAFNYDHVRQKKGFMGGNSIISITAQGLDNHNINHGINEIRYVRGCSLRINKTPSLVLRSSRYLMPPNRPLAVTSHYGRGRAFFGGSYQMFQDGSKDGISSVNNAEFALNIFNWVCGVQPQAPIKPEETLTPKKTAESLVSSARGIPTQQIISRQVDMKMPSTIMKIHEQINALSLRINVLEEKIDHGFRDLKSLIEKIGNTVSIAMGAKLESLEDDTASQDAGLPEITSIEAQQYRNEAINEKQALNELLEYISQRREAGALSEQEFDTQRENLLEKIRHVEDRIGKYSRIISRANP